MRDADERYELEQVQEILEQDTVDHRTDSEVGDELFADLDLLR
jgi:hypothetical protein